MSVFKLDETVLRNVSFKDIWALYGQVDSRGHISVTEGLVDPQDPRYEVKMLGPDASLIARLAKSPAPVRSSGRLTPFTAIQIEDQLHARSQMGFEDMVMLDLYYIQNATPWMDLKLILKTIPVMLFGTGAR